MDEKGFPNDKTMPVFEQAVRELIGIAQHYVNEISPLCDKGDIPIFCQLIATAFINGNAHYIESLRVKNKDSHDRAFKCYLGCVELLRDFVTNEMIVDTFKHPPEIWINQTVSV